MKKISDYKNYIESAIGELRFPDGDLDTLYAPVRYAMSAGGKRLRPVLTLMGTEAFGGEINDAVYPAIGIETFHNFTLLHDDVMDNSDLRRGRATVHKKYDVNAAILSGDTMLTLASQYVAMVDGRLLADVMHAFNDMAIKVYEGQRLDMDFEKKSDVSVGEYIRMIEYKTGALLGAAVMIGAIIGGASRQEARLMYDYGRYIGIAFQIQDDLLDTFGDASTFGKPIGADINNAKKTYLYVKALSEGGQTAETLRSAFEIPAGDLRVKTVTRLYDKFGLKEACKKEVNRCLSLAIKALDDTGLHQEIKESFHEFAEKLIGRKK